MTEEHAFTTTPHKPYLPHSQSLAIGLSTLWCVYLCALIVAPFVSVLAWSAALSVVTHPAFRMLRNRGQNPSLATFISLFCAALMVCLPTLWITQLLVEASLENIGSLIERLKLQDWINQSTAPPQIAASLTWLESSFHIQQVVTDFIQTVTERFPRMVTMSIIGVVQFLLVLFTSFFLIRDAELFLANLKWTIPLPPEETERAVFRVIDTVHATLFGVVFVAVLQGFLGGVMFWWLELPRPLLWGVIMGLLALVPYLGTFIIWIPTAVVLAMHGEWESALILTSWGSIVVGLSDNLLYPLFVGKRLHYHTLLIFIFLLGGMIAFGSAGIVLGPIILSVTHGLIALWQNDNGDPTPEPPLQIAPTREAVGQ